MDGGVVQVVEECFQGRAADAQRRQAFLGFCIYYTCDPQQDRHVGSLGFIVRLRQWQRSVLPCLCPFPPVGLHHDWETLQGIHRDADAVALLWPVVWLCLCLGSI
jgi:hypothetical protein